MPYPVKYFFILSGMNFEHLYIFDSHINEKKTKSFAFEGLTVNKHVSMLAIFSFSVSVLLSFMCKFLCFIDLYSLCIFRFFFCIFYLTVCHSSLSWSILARNVLYEYITQVT